MALDSTQSLTEMSTRGISVGGGGDKGGLYARMTTFSSLCASSLDILETSTSWNPKVLARPVMGWIFILK